MAKAYNPKVFGAFSVLRVWKFLALCGLMAGVCTAALIGSLQVLIGHQEERQALLHHIQDCDDQLRFYESSRKRFQEKKAVWYALKRGHFSEPLSWENLESHLKALGRLYQLHYMSIEKTAWSQMSTPFDPGFVREDFTLKITGAYDGDVFQFLGHLKDKGPGLFVFKEFALSRQEDRQNHASVQGHVRVSWIHRLPDFSSSEP